MPTPNMTDDTQTAAWTPMLSRSTDRIAKKQLFDDRRLNANRENRERQVRGRQRGGIDVRGRLTNERNNAW